MKTVDESFVFPFGKYKGVSVGLLVDIDPTYLVFCFLRGILNFSEQTKKKIEASSQYQMVYGDYKLEDVIEALNEPTEETYWNE